MRMSSPHIKQEPLHDSSPHVDSFHSMSEALQTVSTCFTSLLSQNVTIVYLRCAESHNLFIVTLFYLKSKFYTYPIRFIYDTFCIPLGTGESALIFFLQMFFLHYVNNKHAIITNLIFMR
jgi:hypothetical protein